MSDMTFGGASLRFLLPSGDQSAMREVERSGGLEVLKKIEYLQDGIWLPGALATIGEDVKMPDGTYATLFLVAGLDNKVFLRPRNQVRHYPENGIPEAWLQPLRSGWKIHPSFGSCGCSFAWMKPHPSGSFEMYGCVGHNTPKPEEVGTET